MSVRTDDVEGAVAASLENDRTSLMADGTEVLLLHVTTHISASVVLLV